LIETITRPVYDGDRSLWPPAPTLYAGNNNVRTHWNWTDRSVYYWKYVGN